MRVVKSAWNCINIHSNCIFMQFEWWGMGVRISWRNIWNCIPIVVILHLEICDFSFWSLLLCISKVVTLHCFLRWSFWKPNLQHFSSSYWMSYILPPRILHSLRKPTTFLTRIHFILYQNALHSRKEWSVFSYRT